MSASPELVLYTYFRSSAVFRVRIVLNLKGLKPELRPVHLLKQGGEQHTDSYKHLNPLQVVPTLISGGHVLSQSLAIIEYLDALEPEPPLMPKDALAKARVRQIALGVACDIHPIANLRVLQYLKKKFGADESALLEWQRHWIGEGLTALEAMLAKDPATGRFCHGDSPTLADACLIPQLYNAKQRVNMDLSSYPTLLRIEEAAYKLPAFVAARPENQPDAE
ncbi:MAG TPA: maleylacetoacetate isomerase [Rhizomicrobium sp.]|nr:maleylacetoacetate isomerase [Rhizomicrobium sp.]